MAAIFSALQYTCNNNKSKEDPLWGGNEITWATASEINSDYYIVERSYENEGFEDIGKVDAAGNTLAETSYNFDDEDIDRNGKYY